MLHLHFSNRFERLESALLAAMAATPASPFTHEEIIVPSAAMRRRIELAAADRFGICANVRFSFLAQWLWRQIDLVVPVGEVSPYTSPVLSWRVFRIFGDPAFVQGHPPLATYLEKADAVMRYELAQRAAALLEQYLTYRSDWLAAWLDGRPVSFADAAPARREDERWQRALWRRIAQELGTARRHPAAAFFDAIEAMGADAPNRAQLPERAHVFCLPTMPPLYLDILRRLGRRIDVRLYLQNPCREYWFEIVDPRRLHYLTVASRAEHHEVGNRLLAAWGQQSKAHLELLVEDAGDTALDDSEFVPSETATLLAHVQNAMLEMTDLAPGCVAEVIGDRSIEVHVCHSLTRELEVLQDQLLAAFALPDPPRPCDILIVTPSLEDAAPLIDAVFGNVTGARRIPYAITGRPASVRNPSARALLALLALAASRFQASVVFDLLQQPIIARRFDLGSVEQDRIRRWIHLSGIRWGIDGGHRARLDLPNDARYSFSDGLDRLFLGYALPAEASTPLNGRLAAGNAEGSAALALGSLREFVRRIERLHFDLAQPRTSAEWRSTLLGVIDAFLAPADDEVDEVREATAAIDALADDMAHGGLHDRVSAPVVQTALQALLDDPTRGGVPTGAVSFAAMTSLRGLPYRMIGVIGLDDGAFPTSKRPEEFDLMALDPRRGDRQRRHDERNVFLDLLLAARERFYLSYTGRNVRDNSPLPPSVLIAELLDYLVVGATQNPSDPVARQQARHQLVVEHPLQPFALAYFEAGGDTRRRSSNGEYCEALRQRLSAVAAANVLQPAFELAPEPSGAGIDDLAEVLDDDADDDAIAEPVTAFFPVPLAKAGPEFRDVTLDQLVRFFGNPCRHLLKLRLGIELARGDEELQDDEPFVVDWPTRSALAERVLPRLLEGATLAEMRVIARAGTEYPSGRLGEIALDRELQSLRAYADALATALQATRVAPVSTTLDFTLEGEAWRLAGGFGDLRANGYIGYRYDNARARDYLDGWIRHLFLNVAAPPGVALRTAWHSRDGTYVVPPCADAHLNLEAFLRLYRQGLERPLHFYPKSAWAYMTHGRRIRAASSAWLSSTHHEFGEDRDPAYRLALRGVPDPLDAEFERAAVTVFAPLLEIIVDGRLA